MCAKEIVSRPIYSVNLLIKLHFIYVFCLCCEVLLFILLYVCTNKLLTFDFFCVPK